jgi:hypothetical protein
VKAQQFSVNELLPNSETLTLRSAVRTEAGWVVEAVAQTGQHVRIAARSPTPGIVATGANYATCLFKKPPSTSGSNSAVGVAEDANARAESLPSESPA